MQGGEAGVWLRLLRFVGAVVRCGAVPCGATQALGGWATRTLPWSRIDDRRRLPYYCYWRVGMGSPEAAGAETLEISTSRARAMR